MTTVALIAAGATSTGGLTALVMRKRAGRSQLKPSAESAAGGFQPMNNRRRPLFPI